MRLTARKNSTDVLSRVQRMTSFIPVLTLCALLTPAFAAQESSILNGTVENLYQTQRYEDAAKVGLEQLLSEPWNHDLRFLVADCLQRLGKFDEAAVQFESLEGTPYAERAMLRLNALRSNTQQDAPVELSGVAQEAAVATESQPENTPTPEVSNRRLAYTLIPAEAASNPHSPAQQRLFDLNTAGDYQTLGTAGLAAFQRTPPDDELRLIVANSLAWTGRSKQAEAQYKLIGPGRYKHDADVGLANLYRWNGREDKSLPLYQSVLRDNPKDEAAQQGLMLAERELRPRTTLSFGGASDSAIETNHPVTLNHRWRDVSGRNIYELEGGLMNAHKNGIRADQRDLTARYQSLDLPLQPKFELSQQVKPVLKLYGKVGIKLADNEVSLEAGRDNWGKTAATTQALLYGLGANHLGATANHVFDFGQILAAADFYAISDGNTIRTSKLDYKPAWTPLGNHIKPYVGMETRDAKNNSLLYWSPGIGYGSAYAGLQGEWGKDQWGLFGSGQMGTHLYGEAGTSWSLSAGGKYWLTNDIAFNLSLWKMQSWRNNSTYRAKSFNLGLEKLWD
jgi:tetratricopeptide (TPR) repeat protein